MILLRGPEFAGIDNRRHDRLFERLRLLDRDLRCFGETALFRVVHEDRRAVLSAVIAELAVGHRRIDVVPEHVEQFLVRDLRRVVDHLDGLGMTRRARGDFFIGRVPLLPAGVAGRRREDARSLVERRLHAPEASARKCRDRLAGRSGVRLRLRGSGDDGAAKNRCERDPFKAKQVLPHKVLRR